MWISSRFLLIDKSLLYSEPFKSPAGNAAKKIIRKRRNRFIETSVLEINRL